MTPTFGTWGRARLGRLALLFLAAPVTLAALYLVFTLGSSESWSVGHSHGLLLSANLAVHLIGLMLFQCKRWRRHALGTSITAARFRKRLLLADGSGGPDDIVKRALGVGGRAAGDRTASVRVQTAYRQFEYWWVFAWWAMLLLYLLLTATAMMQRAHADTYLHVVLIKSGVAFAKNLCSCAIFICFWVSSHVTVSKDNPGQTTNVYHAMMGALLTAVALLILQLVITSAVFFGDSEIGYLNAEKYHIVFNTIAGLFNAVAIGMLGGRLGSKFIGAGAWIISIIYGYAAIQPLFGMLPVGDNMIIEWLCTMKGSAISPVLKNQVLYFVEVPKLMLLSAALVFKIFVLALATWLIHSARLEYYFLGVRELHETVAHDWQLLTAAMSPVEEPVLTLGPVGPLRKLLRSLFSASQPDALRQWVEGLRHGPLMIEMLPSPPVSFRTLVHRTVDLLRDQGGITHETFASLVELYPGRAQDIYRVRGIVLNGDAPESAPQGPPSQGPASQERAIVA